MNKTILKKLLISLTIIVLMTNFIAANNIVVVAEDDPTAGEVVVDGVIYVVNVLEESLNVVMGSVVGLLTKPFRAIALALANGLDDLTADIAYSQGTVQANGDISPDTFFREIGEIGKSLLAQPSITPFDILFNKLAIVDINFFNIPSGNSIIRNMRVAIASWYYVMRNIAAAILLCVLIYVGIRMAISTVASDKAAYSKMLVDWVCSLALIFLIQYIIIFTIEVNEALVNALKGVSENDGISLVRAMASIKLTAKNWFTLDSIAATIVYCMLVGQTLSLLISYFNRMLKLAFLVIISPLITLTYSMDKMGDGKAQALGTWLKEFVYTVLIQSFHCIIYMVFIKMAVSILDSGVFESYNLAGSFLAVLCVKFTKDAEKILGKIFKFGDSTSDASLATGMLLSAAAFQNATKIGKGTVKAVNGVKSFAHNAGAFAHTWKVSRLAVQERKKARAEGRELSMEEAKLKAEETISAQEAADAESKAGKSYTEGEKGYDENYKKAVDAAAEKYKGTGMSADAARDRARAEIARQVARDKKHPRIASFRGRMQPYKDLMRDVRSTEAYKQLSQVAKGYVSTGVALFAGSTMYGMNGDAFKSLTMGGTMFKGTQEVFKNSSRTMTDSTESILRGMDVKSESEAVAQMELAQGLAPILGNNSELDKKLEDLLSFVDRALSSEMDPEGSNARKIKTSIRNTIQSELKKNPAISDAELMKKVTKNLTSHSGASEASIDAVENAAEFGTSVEEVSTWSRRKELYDSMQNASNLGLEPGTFASMVGKRFRGEGASAHGIDMSPDPERSKDVRKLEKRLESQRIEDRDEMTPEEINMAVNQQEQTVDRIQDRCMQEFDGMVSGYETRYDELAKKLETELEDAAREEIRTQMEQIQREFERDFNRFKVAYQDQISVDPRPDEDNGKKYAYMGKITEDHLKRAEDLIAGTRRTETSE